ncbi:unnamed protein product [Symbiodinium pilosum]|uniref:Uncharacterized protein n=1 Tax=Symbiodinium pilosum TaxID=2952 RepID=A0A812UUJ1_SYMPI|nr:unnamed protein product [Symbiodinium pilosum]
MDPFSQFDLLAYPALNFDWLSHFDILACSALSAAQQGGAQVSQQLPGLASHANSAGQYVTTVAIAVAGAAAAFMAAEGNVEPAQVDEAGFSRHRLSREVLKMVYRECSHREVVQAVREPSWECQPVRALCRQAGQQSQLLAAELEAKGIKTMKDLARAFAANPHLWMQMRLHSGEKAMLEKSVRLGVDGLLRWHVGAVPPGASNPCGKSGHVLPTSAIVLASRISLQARHIRSGTKLLSFDFEKGQKVLSRVVKCREETWLQRGCNMLRDLGRGPSTIVQVTLRDQDMHFWQLRTLPDQLLWCLTPHGYAWLPASSDATCSHRGLQVGDMLVRQDRHLCLCVIVHVDILPQDHEGLIEFTLEGRGSFFINGFLATAGG